MDQKSDALMAKISIIRNCRGTIKKVTQGNPETLDDVIVQDVFVLNLERAAQACIDMAHLVISEKGLAMPSSYKQSFQIFQKSGIITPDTSQQMQKMAGFRNIAVHDYQQINIDILKSILSNRLGDFETFCREMTST